MTAATSATTGPGALDVLSLVAEVADELVVRTARDTHVAVLDRLERVVGRTGYGRWHRTLAAGVYGGIGLGLRGARRGIDAVAKVRPGDGTPGTLAGPRGRTVHATVNGLIGDRLARERPAWAYGPTVRVEGRDVPVAADSLRTAFPGATGRLAVLVHGWCETEEHWDWQVERRGPGYADTVAGLGWTPVRLRLNTGLSVRDNGVALAALLHDLSAAWPVPVTRIALVGHSMGGLVVRAAAAAADPEESWAGRVSDVVTLGTPHLGAPLAAGVERGSAHLARLPETAALGRLLDWRSVGVRDLVLGLGPDVPSLPRARYRLVSATLASSPRHPVSWALGDAMVRQGSAYGRTTRGDDLFAGAEVLHLPRTGHLAMLNHPEVHRALARWLA